MNSITSSRELAAQILDDTVHLERWRANIAKLSGGGALSSELRSFLYETDYWLKVSFEAAMPLLLEFASRRFPKATEQEVVQVAIPAYAALLAKKDWDNYRVKHGKDATPEQHDSTLKTYLDELSTRWANFSAV